MPTAVLCVCVRYTTMYPAESNRVCGGNAYTSVLLDCRGRRKKRWEWQPSSLLTHVWVCDLQATLSTLSTRAATPAAAQQNTRPTYSLDGPAQLLW
jgi:hypothetical protein